MGKKDKKKKDPEKLAALQAKKDAKADKAARKRLNKEQKALDEAVAISGGGDGGEDDGGGEDIDALLESYRQQSADLANPVIEALDPPGSFPYPPRGNATLTVCPDGDMALFGGEHHDGVENIVFDELLRWSPDAKPTDDDDDVKGSSSAAQSINAGEWKRVLSPPPHPPARCSHSTVVFNNALYIFGGEYATADQYHHYRDLWKFDLKTNLWEEMRPLKKNSPAPRSGHRAIVWRHYMIIFGGFYEALRETKWYNDLHVWDFQTNTWTEMVYSKLATIPPPRSAFNFGLMASKSDQAFVFGGFSKLKNPAPGSRAEGKTHTDCWALNLKPILQGKVPTWDRLSRKGEYPSSRSGTACVSCYKNTRMLVYGGVNDDEGDNHKVSSVFYDDLFAFDMERRRWFSMPIKKKGDGSGGRRRRKKGNDDNDNGEQDENEDDNDDDDSIDGDETKDGEAESSGWDISKLRSNMFAFIDGEGNIVYEKIDEEEGEEEGEKTGKEEETDAGYEADTGDTDAGLQSQTKNLTLHDKIPKQEEGNKETDTENMNKNSSLLSSSFSKTPLATVPNGAICTSEVMHINTKTGLPESITRQTPLPRINAALVVRGNTLYVYGGLLEVGDREVTLDDCWVLDLNKRDGWTCLFGGTMHKQVWRGAESDNESYVSTDRMGDDGDFDEEDESDGEQELKGEDDNGPEDEDAKKAAKKAAKKEAKKEKKRGIRDEIAKLKGQLDLDDANRTPMMGEAMADFYSRTTEYWNQKAMEKIAGGADSEDKETESVADGSGGGERLTAKELKREGFALARKRYEELTPVLERLNDLDAQQREAEEGKKSKDKKKKSKDKSGSSSKEKKRGR
mmetsp:Transcript_15274/g.22488  ORF Transcript_15274/g.22488 Transcript_15274/m.22488 type:complete len:850 (+) Transcript_15274:146-2695(+)